MNSRKNILVDSIRYYHNRIEELCNEQDKLIFELGNLDDNALDELLKELEEDDGYCGL